MDSTDNKILAIERYLSGEMSADEKLAFEKQLHEDSELNYLLQFRQSATKSWHKLQEYDSIHTSVEDIIQQYRHQKRIRTIRLIAAGITIPLLIGAAILLFFKPDNLSDQYAGDEKVILENPQMITQEFNAALDSFNIDAQEIVSEKMPITNIADIHKRKNYVERGFIRLSWNSEEFKSISTDVLYIQNKNGIDLFRIDVDLDAGYYMINTIDMEPGKYTWGLRNAGMKSSLIIRK